MPRKIKKYQIAGTNSKNELGTNYLPKQEEWRKKLIKNLETYRKKLESDLEPAEIKTLRETGVRPQGNPVLKILDIASDIGQFGNFIPHPVAQTIGKFSSGIGAVVDGMQAVDNFRQGNTTEGLINTGSALFSSVLRPFSFMRNSKYAQTRPMWNKVFGETTERVGFPNIMKLVKNGKTIQTPFQLAANRTLFGALGAETAYDTMYQDGGVNIDPMGYWNPDNYGQPVIIPSNSISMENVPYDVVGIDNLGNKKIMKPNRKYKFKGESVLEFPLMQQGGFNPQSFNDNAEYNYYKKMLFEKLRSKNPEQFSLMEQELSQNAQNPINQNSQTRQRITEKYNIALGEDELKESLGGKFDRFNELRNKYKYNYDYGMIEKSPETMRQFSVNDIAITSLPSSYQNGNVFYKPIFDENGLSLETNMPGFQSFKTMPKLENSMAIKQRGGFVQNDYWHNRDNSSDFSGLMDMIQQYNVQQQSPNDYGYPEDNITNTEPDNSPVYEDLIARITELENQIQQSNKSADDVEYDAMFDYIMGDSESGLPIDWEAASKAIGQQILPQQQDLVQYTNNQSNRVSNKSLEQQIADVESSGGNYRLLNPKSSATGKYQFLWKTWGPAINKVTGVNTREGFRNNPEAQENFFAWYKQNELLPAAQRLKKYNTLGLSDNDLAKLVHYKGEAGAKKWLTTGIDPTPKNNMPIQKYLNYSR